MTPQYILATSIEVPIPKTNSIVFSAAEVSHNYIGPNINAVTLWTRVEPYPCWSVFILEADFSKAPQEWFSGYQRVDEIDVTEGSWKEIEHKRVWDHGIAESWIEPNLPGRRFIWFWYGSPLENSDVELKDGKEDEPGNPKRLVHLRSSVLGHVPTEKMTNILEDLDRQRSRDDYWNALHSQNLMAPVDFEIQPVASAVYSIAMDEWSGTVTVILINGDVWVLRYSPLM
jgi:hypothetical protein